MSTAAQSLDARMRARRETWFAAGGVELLIRRPRDLDVAKVRAAGGGWSDVAIAAVVDWRGVKVADLIPGEVDKPAPFSAAAFEEWVGDRMDVLKEVTVEVVRLIDEHAAQRQATEKN